MAEREITNDCVAVAFYGIRADGNLLRSFYDDLLTWFEQVDCPPDKISVHAPGFGGKNVGFKRTHSRLLKTDFTEVESLHLYSMLPDGEIPTVHWWAAASISLKKKWVFVEARSSVARLDDDCIKHLVRRCIDALNPQYGIGYHRDHDNGPGFYAIGLVYVTIKNITGGDDSEAISKWGYVGLRNEVYQDGVLRDVYPYNYLTRPALNRRIGRQTLRTWIAGDRSRGELTDLENGVSLWRVAESQVVSIRETLSDAGILFHWEEYG